MNHSLLVEKHINLLAQSSKLAPVLDLACGSGRNGLYLINNNIPVVFADIKSSALEQVKTAVAANTADVSSSVDFWQVDFEQDSTEHNSALQDSVEQAELQPLTGKCYSAVMVFRYLHRPLFEQIKQAVMAGGYVIYETFTVDQSKFGRPSNPKFLLKHGELAERFADWDIIHRFEGVVDANNESGKQAIAQIVARKPL